MKRLFCILAGFFPLCVFGQYNGPAVEACRAYALKELQRDGNQVKAVVIERDEALSFERDARKVGSQPVRGTLTGHGAVVYGGAPSAELSFVCLLADEKRPVFFSWQPRPNAPALAQCVRTDELRGKAPECLQLLLRMAEQDLAQVYAYRFQEANERGEKSLAVYRKSNDEWREYRDAECARQREAGEDKSARSTPASTPPEHRELACRVDLTRRRALDMR